MAMWNKLNTYLIPVLSVWTFSPSTAFGAENCEPLFYLETEQEFLGNYGEQLAQPVEHWDSHLDADGWETVFPVQAGGTSGLYLTANEVFFDGSSGLSTSGSLALTDPAKVHNGNRVFSSLDGFGRTSDPAVWGVYFRDRGWASLDVVFAEVPAEGFSLALVGEGFPSAGERQRLCSVTAGGESGPPTAYRVHVFVERPGPYRLELRSGADSTQSASIEYLRLAGAPAESAGVVRMRWRPFAVHTRFESTKVTSNVRAWVMEFDIKPSAWQFSPVTTPFGYFGPVMEHGRYRGMNFSFWSYGRNADPPPLTQWSHLLSVGDPALTFGEFHHEGHGVKVRGKTEPFGEYPKGRLIVGMRVQPQEHHDVYTSYFYSDDEKRWKLFASGAKANRGNPIRSLWVGSFMEVAGPPHRQRSAHATRSNVYRGWVADEQGEWHALDQMKFAGRGILSNGVWRVGEDGRFEMRLGGFAQRLIPKTRHVLTRTPDPLPEFLLPEQIDSFYDTPILVENLDLITGFGMLFVTLELPFPSADGTRVTVFHGSEDMLTFENRWPAKFSFTATEAGRHTVPVVPSWGGERVHVRVLLEDERGKQWSQRTLSAPW